MTDNRSEAKPRVGSRLLWFICLYCVGAVSVALVAYGVRFWVGG